MSNNQCVACGRFAGRGHRCPTPATSQPPSEMQAPARTANTQRGTEDRVARAQAVLAQAPTADAGNAYFTPPAPTRPLEQTWNGIDRNYPLGTRERVLQLEAFRRYPHWTQAERKYLATATTDARRAALNQGNLVQGDAPEMVTVDGIGVTVDVFDPDLRGGYVAGAWCETDTEVAQAVQKGKEREDARRAEQREMDEEFRKQSRERAVKRSSSQPGGMTAVQMNTYGIL